MTQATRATLKYSMYGIKTDYSDYSKLACDYMEAAPDGPNAPSSVTAVGALSCIVVSWVAPTESVDGSDLAANKILGYNVYRKAGSAPTKSSYDAVVFVTATTYVYTISATTDTYFVVTTISTDEEESVESSSVHDSAELILHGETPITDPTGGLWISNEFLGFFDSDPAVNDWVAYIRNNGDFFLGGAAGKLQWDYSSSSLLVEGTYRSNDDAERIEITGIGENAHWAMAYDSSNKGRAGINNAGLYVWNSDGKSDGNRIVYLPSTASTDAFMAYNNIIFHNTVIVGRTTDPSTSDDLYVDGSARLGDGSYATSITVGDHGAATDPFVVGVVYGTGSPPSASSVPEGTLFVCYTA